VGGLFTRGIYATGKQAMEKVPEGCSVRVRTKKKPQVSPLRCAPVEMTILWQNEIPRFQERSVELQIPRLRSHGTPGQAG
jgi:hypothetical protein